MASIISEKKTILIPALSARPILSTWHFQNHTPMRNIIKHRDERCSWGACQCRMGQNVRPKTRCRPGIYTRSMCHARRGTQQRISIHLIPLPSRQLSPTLSRPCLLLAPVPSGVFPVCFLPCFQAKRCFVAVVDSALMLLCFVFFYLVGFVFVFRFLF